MKMYMVEPDNDEKVHDVRTALRRLDASFFLMPKELRRRNRRQIDTYKKFFRANSRVRDCDIIRSRIAMHACGDLLSQLGAKLDNKRKAELAGALGLARLASGLPAASLDGLEDKDLELRMDRVAGRFVRKVKSRLPAVTADSGAVEELHQLRKDLKKLRYALELMPSGLKRPYEKKVSKILKGNKAEDRLKELQDILGNIHDIDITVQYLESLQKQAVASILEEEKAERDRLFSRFTKSIGT